MRKKHKPRKRPLLPPHRATSAEMPSFHQKPLFIYGLRTFQRLTPDTQLSCFATLNSLWILKWTRQRERLFQMSQLHFWKNGRLGREQRNCRVRQVGTLGSDCAWIESRECRHSATRYAPDTLFTRQLRCLHFANLCAQPHEWNTQKAPLVVLRANTSSCEVHPDL